MLFVGFFSFEFEDPELGKRDAEFSYLIEAETLDDATERMAENIMANHQDILQGTDRLMLDDLIEIIEMPADGVLLKFSHAPATGEMVFHTVLPNNDSDECSNYRQGPNPCDDPEGASEFVPEPFLLLEDAEEADEEDGEE